MTVGSWRRGDVVLDLYEVLDVLDGGGMGLVHRVRHRGWNTDLAVKVPRPELVATAAGRADFETEAGTWVGLGLHPHVVNCLYVRRVDEIPCVFAEWVGGGSLAELVRDGRLYAEGTGGTGDAGGTGGSSAGALGGGEPSLARALDLAAQIAWGIDHAHRQGVIHQDVKPANIMVDVDADWTAKVTDFGIAGARAAAGESAAVPPGASLAASYGGRTPAYCSPEQADAAAGARVTLTRATDVWSWALCVLEMFTGGPPCLYGQTAPEVFAAFLESGGRAGPAVPAMPPALAELLHDCFAIDPDARPRGMAELATAVRRIHADIVGGPPARPEPQAANLLADGLSNQALSLLDLGRPEEAEELWRTAADIDPHHPSTVYNWALHRWRQGVLTDEQAVSELSTARTIEGARWTADHLLGLVHVERGDDDAARALLTSAPPDLPEVEAALDELERRGRIPERVRRHGHRGGVRALAVDATGAVALTGGEDGRIRVWSTADGGHCRYELPRTPATEDAPPVTAVAVTADGRTGLSARGEGILEVWDLAAGTLLRTLPGHATRVTEVALNGAGLAAVAYDGGPVQVWDLAGRLIREFVHPPRPYRKLDPRTGRSGTETFHEPSSATVLGLSEDGAAVVSAAPRDGSVVVWDVAAARPLHRLVTSADFHRTGIDEVVLSPYGTYALLLDHLSGELRLWETRTDRIRTTAPNHFDRHAVFALDGEGTLAASVGVDGTAPPLRIWETRTGRCLRTISLVAEEHPFPQPRCVALSGDARVLVVGDEGGDIQVQHLPPPGFRAGWSYARPRTALALEDGETRARQAIERAEELAGRGSFAAAAEELRAARAIPGFERHPHLRALWNDLGREAGRSTDLLGIWQRYDLSGTWILTQKPTFALSRDGELAVTGGADGRVRVWELQTGQCLHQFPERVANTHTVLIADDRGLAVTADWGGAAHLWSFESGTRRCQLYGDHGHVTSVAMDPAGRRALVGDSDGALCLWDLTRAGATLIRTMVGHEGKVGAVRLSDDGKYAASAGLDDRTGRLWQTATGRPLLDFPVGFGDTTLRFSPEGGRLFVNDARQVAVWDVRARRQIRTEEVAYHATLAMSADGRVAATSGIGTIRVWDTESGRTLCEIPEFTEMYDLSPDGRHLLTGAHDRVLRLWDVRTGACVHQLEGHPVSLAQVAFTADGRNIVSTDLRPALRLWELDRDYDFTAGTGAG
ncbi:protein kinase [Streptomyces sp. NPDC003035]|uniref:protein kinase domain-containing protein n=1 Tax=Streptomyces sp. NPDC003035 TaxID=3364676 RepID=UPI0036B28A5F